MGVPGFFLWLHKNYKKKSFVFVKEKINNKEITDELNNIDYFLIDTNCLIHPMCFKILAENPELDNQDKLENKMINKVLEYIEEISNYVKPKKGIFIAIDGVAPVAKIKQQRSRRFKSVHDKELWDKIKKITYFKDFFETILKYVIYNSISNRQTIYINKSQISEKIKNYDFSYYKNLNELINILKEQVLKY